MEFSCACFLSSYPDYADSQTCRIGSLASWKGRWVDVTNYAQDGHAGQGVHFQHFKEKRGVPPVK